MKEDFDDILKKRWAEKTFSMDENHRLDMIRLLDQQKRRKVFPFWWFGGALAVFVVGIYFFMNPPDLSFNNTAAPKTTQESATVITDGSDPSVSAQADAQVETPGSHANNTMERSATSEFSVSSSEFDKPSRINKNTGNNQSTSANSFSKTPSTPASKAHDRKPKQSLAPGSLQAANEPNVESGIVSALTTDIPVHTDRDKIIPDHVHATEVIPVVQIPRPLVQPVDFLFRDITLVEQEVENTVGEILGVEPQNATRKPFFFFGETGLGMILASRPDYTAGWKLRAGAGLGFKVSPGFQVMASGGYLYQNGGFTYQRYSAIQRPGFGLRSSFNSLEPEKLHYVYARAGGQYRLQRHILAAHGGAQWLYGAQGKIVVQHVNQFEPDDEMFTQNTWLKTDGLRRMHWTADLGYGYQFSRRMVLMAGADVYFASFTIEDPVLTSEGYYWRGNYSSIHPFLTLNYLIHESR